jgi:hypothetical protein
MTWAQFEEKEYEDAANGEIHGRGFVFAAGPVMEAVLGYDAATAPDHSHPLWSVLGAPRPRGMRLLPALWSPGEAPPGHKLPPVPISLILQYKRPEFLRGGAAKQWSLWRREYFRFTRYEPQQRVLLRLERATHGDVLVRYAAPAFWEQSDLDVARLARLILDWSGFVPPSALAGHKVWTYTEPGTYGRANPAGPWTRFQSIEELLNVDALDVPTRQAVSLDIPGGLLRRHLAVLGEAARDREPVLRQKLARWDEQLRRLDLEDYQREQLVDIAAVTSVTSRIGADWLMLADPQTKVTNL